MFFLLTRGLLALLLIGVSQAPGPRINLHVCSLMLCLGMDINGLCSLFSSYGEFMSEGDSQNKTL